MSGKQAKLRRRREREPQTLVLDKAMLAQAHDLSAPQQTMTVVPGPDGKKMGFPNTAVMIIGDQALLNIVERTALRTTEVIFSRLEHEGILKPAVPPKDAPPDAPGNTEVVEVK